jgi:hypothetical protein
VPRNYVDLAFSTTIDECQSRISKFTILFLLPGRPDFARSVVEHDLDRKPVHITAFNIVTMHVELVYDPLANSFKYIGHFTFSGHHRLE